MTRARTRRRGSRRRVAYVLCYRDPHYLRTLTLTRALESIDDIELVVVKNTRCGVARYAETLARAASVRLRHRPDTWIVGFRGHEIFPLLYPLMAGSEIVFDEFVNLHGWLVEERRVVSAGSPVTRVLDALVRWIVRRSTVVLSDTDAQADYSARIYRVPRDTFRVVPVGADERTFFPRPHSSRTDGRFEVLFFATMLPLHGTGVLLEAIRILRSRDAHEAIHCTLIGGRGKSVVLDEISKFIRENGLNESVTHLPWVDYAELPDYIAAADLCIGGPLGGTPQARRVVTGKTYQFLASGKATLVGEVDATTELHDKENCLLVPQGSSVAVAEAIAWAAAHPVEIREIGARGRAYFERSFSSTQIAAAVEAALPA